MTPQGARLTPISDQIYINGAGKEYTLAREPDGTSRRLYKRVCLTCKKEDWLLPSKAKGILCCYCKRKAPLSKETKEKISKTLREKYTSSEYKEKVTNAQNPKSGFEHWNWKGGVSPANQKERNSKQAADWRREIFLRDSFTCRTCGQIAGKLEAHHIEPWCSFPEKRYCEDNGITMCKKCHLVVHNYLKEIYHHTSGS